MQFRNTDTAIKHRSPANGIQQHLKMEPYITPPANSLWEHNAGRCWGYFMFKLIFLFQMKAGATCSWAPADPPGQASSMVQSAGSKVSPPPTREDLWPGPGHPGAAGGNILERVGKEGGRKNSPHASESSQAAFKGKVMVPTYQMRILMMENMETFSRSLGGKYSKLDLNPHLSASFYSTCCLPPSSGLRLPFIRG